MKNLEVSISHQKEQTLYGLWRKSNDKTISKDIRALSEKYHLTGRAPEKKVFPFFVLSRNYDERSGDFELFIGSVTKRNGLKRYTLAAGEFAIIRVRPKWGFLWGVSIKEAKQYFYGKWLEGKTYQALNLEYEYHTEISAGNRPEIEIFFAVRREENSVEAVSKQSDLPGKA